MELNLLIHTFNSFGGGSTFGSVMALVDLHEESFGDGLKEIELQLYFKSKLPFAKQRANASLRELYEEFHNKNCNMLPIRRFMRKKGELKIQALAEFAAAEDVTGPSYPLNLEWQVAALDVLIREVEACRRKFKPTDDIRFNEFLDWLREQHGNLPKTQKEAEELDKRWRDAEDKKREQMDEWESLGLNWDDYHENARDVVSDPRLWSQGHDFSPNGNDSGADLIYMFRAEKARWARGGGNAFYQNLARDWGFDSDAKPDDSNSYEMKRESIIGLAFAFLKLFAYCPDWLANETIQTIEDYKTYL
ncbi:MAG: hypothetical protein QGF59_29745, partial [Pirellulaceae bacterium]|nr:hypothetical protein [Pirellulaceae bacterium]